MAAEISHAMSDTYYFCHAAYSDNIGHQAVRLLHLLDHEDHVTVGRVAEELGSAANTASELVDRLVDRGLVERLRSQLDRRVVHLHLTVAGRNALSQHVGYDVSRLAAALATLPAADRQAVTDGYRILADHLKTQSGCAPKGADCAKATA
jgi:DNA-binding MarR family transcriptional regulator